MLKSLRMPEGANELLAWSLGATIVGGQIVAAALNPFGVDVAWLLIVAAISLVVWLLLAPCVLFLLKGTDARSSVGLVFAGSLIVLVAIASVFHERVLFCAPFIVVAVMWGCRPVFRARA